MVKRYKTPEHALKVNFCREPASPSARQQKDHCCILKSFFCNAVGVSGIQKLNRVAPHSLASSPFATIESHEPFVLPPSSDGVLINITILLWNFRAIAGNPPYLFG